jgi:hypothetical protein
VKVKVKVNQEGLGKSDLRKEQSRHEGMNRYGLTPEEE